MSSKTSPNHPNFGLAPPAWLPPKSKLPSSDVSIQTPHFKLQPAPRHPRKPRDGIEKPHPAPTYAKATTPLEQKPLADPVGTPFTPANSPYETPSSDSYPL
ncbi:hypothetical protein TWF481_002978 [Arthrobotrys musiformis]|uniref:Uncharacterized protein n=1 Tax=Arthrobotrys musiformis TaxID=47236 RepID=A0AAV9VTJ0_9PEZI